MIFLHNKSSSQSLTNQRSSNSNRISRASTKSITKQETFELVARILAIITVISVLSGIGLLIYGAITKFLALLISGAVVIVFGIAFLGLTILFYLKANPTSSFYAGKTQNSNRVDQINTHEMKADDVEPGDNVLYAIEKMATISNNFHENRPEPDASAVHTV